MSIEVIDSKINELNNRINAIENRPTEVYSRIVGYYRSVKNWNNGKSAEYKVRKTFMEPETVACQPPMQKESVPAPAVVEEAAAIELTVATEEIREHNDQADLFSLSDKEEITREEKNADTYSFFFRNTCPNCPPMKEYIGSLDLQGNHINVDEEEGLNAAVENNVFTAPTVILFSSEGSELFRTDNVNGLKDFISSGASVVAAS